MEIVIAKSNKLKRQYIKLLYSIYKGDTCYVDTAVFNLKTLLYGKSSFAKSIEVIPVLVEDGGIFCGEGMIFYSEGDTATLGYLECRETRLGAINKIIEYAVNWGKSKGIKKLFVGVNAHISYGVGILDDSFSEKISFDSLYCKPWIKDVFAGYEYKTLTTYRTDDIKDGMTKIPDYGGGEITVRKMDMRKFKEELLLLNALCNQTLDSTDMFEKTGSGHMFELIGGMKPLLRPENLLFVMQGGKEKGFLFWHPDYNSILPPGRRNSALGIAARYFLKKHKITKYKINCIGVLPAYQSTKLTLTLLKFFVSVLPRQAETVDTTFIWDSNEKSSRLARRFFKENRHYKVYQIDVPHS